MLRYDSRVSTLVGYQVFLRVLHNFFPWCRSDRVTALRRTHHEKVVYPDRPPPPLEDVLWAPWARSIRRAQAPRLLLSMPLSVGAVKALLGGVFRRFTSSFQVGVEAIIEQKYFGVFFRSITSNSARDKIIASMS